MLNSHNSLEGLKIDGFAASMGWMTLPSSKALKKMVRRVQSANGDAVEKTKPSAEKDEDREDVSLFIPVERSLQMTSTAGPRAPPLLKSLSETWQECVKVSCPFITCESGGVMIGNKAMDALLRFETPAIDLRSCERDFIEKRLRIVPLSNRGRKKRHNVHENQQEVICFRPLSNWRYPRAAISKRFSRPTMKNRHRKARFLSRGRKCR